MDIFSIFDPEFRAYGRVVRGYGRERFALAKILEEKTPCPEEGTRYVGATGTIQSSTAWSTTQAVSTTSGRRTSSCCSQKGTTSWIPGFHPKG